VSKRHLPVLQTPAQDDDPPRPHWQWVGFGAAAIFGAWVALSAIVAAIARGTLRAAGSAGAVERVAFFNGGLYLAELALGAIAGGYLVGRWGPSDLGVRHGALAGLVAAAVVAFIFWLTSSASFGPLLVAVLAPIAAAGGARLGRVARGTAGQTRA
jgi:peptidoglycan/LPS O-acetylase OafA/YrhL